MSYYAEFTGQFDCYRVDGPIFGAFLQDIRRGDGAALRAFVDWLIEQGDSRSEAAARAIGGPVPDTAAFWRLFGLRPKHTAYLTKFRDTRRMRRDPALAARLPDSVREAAGLPHLQEYERLLRTERYQEAMQMMQTSYERGKQEGEQEGERKGLRQAILWGLEHRFGPVSDPVRQRVLAWPGERLKELFDALFSVASLRDLGLED
jgi:hypothetical protein